MGGRGASSGISEGTKKSPKGNPYGSQYSSLLTVGNIKFVVKNDRNSETLMETMTRGRVYVVTGGNDLISIVYFDNNGKRVKSINLNHFHNGLKPHTHHGYEHNENDGPKGAANLTPDEKRMVARVQRIWYNYLQKQKRGAT